ncbi:hypothetical protein B0O99DRAFT_505416, partial [Bisporella sp. PMI_857]
DAGDKRLFSTGCGEYKMNDCYYGKKYWRLCKDELEIFLRCWKTQANDKEQR